MATATLNPSKTESVLARSYNDKEATEYGELSASHSRKSVKNIYLFTNFLLCQIINGRFHQHLFVNFVACASVYCIYIWLQRHRKFSCDISCFRPQKIGCHCKQRTGSSLGGIIFIRHQPS